MQPRPLWLYLFLAMASHGLLDALTNGGLGIALFAPLENSRYFFPVTPIQVSPIGIRRFFRGGGLAVLASELPWVWLPSLLLAGIALGWKRVRRSTTAVAWPANATGGTTSHSFYLGGQMTDHIYKTIELVGSSATGVEDAIRNAVAKASQTLRNLRWFEVVETRGHIEGSEVAHWQVTLKIGFTLEGNP
jgi:flavin-binding protein dodecin